MKSYLEQILERLKEEGHFQEKNSQELNLQENEKHEEWSHVDVLEFIESYGLNFNNGKAVAHIVGSNLEGEDELYHLRIAAWHLNREIKRLENEQG